MALQQILDRAQAGARLLVTMQGSLHYPDLCDSQASGIVAALVQASRLSSAALAEIPEAVDAMRLTPASLAVVHRGIAQKAQTNIDNASTRVDLQD